MRDYFDTRKYSTLQALLTHAQDNHNNAKRFARLGRTNCKDHFHYAELACEDKAHRHAILRRAEELMNPASDEKSWMPPSPEDKAAYVQIQNVCFKTSLLKV